MFVDFHCDTLSMLEKYDWDLTKKNDKGHIDLVRLKEGMVHIQVFATFVSPEHMKKSAATKTLKMIDKLYQLIKKTHELQLILKSDDIDSVKKANKIGALLSIEGGEALEGNLALLRMFYKLGVRAMTLTWSLRNDLGDGVEGCESSGLTNFGIEVLNEMNELGMIVDVSHLNEKGFWDVINMHKRPVVASHSDCRALCNHPRNLTDEQIKAIADTEGVIGINFCTHFLRDDGNASIDDVLNHIDHIVNLVGVNHVGFGSDFDGIEETPKGLEDTACFPKLIDGLKARGYNVNELYAICHKNFERVIKNILK